MRTTIAGLLLVGVLSVSAVSAAQDGPSGKTVIAGGGGVSVGVVGALIARRLGDLPLAAALGLGIEGIAPQVQLDLLSSGDFNLHLAAAVLYDPWGGLVSSRGSVLPAGTLGVQRWPYRGQHGGVFLNGEVEIVKQVRGSSEGSGEDRWHVGVGAQVGAAF